VESGATNRGNNVTDRSQGVVLGRFQPLHIGHVEYLEAARACCKTLTIGITSPDAASLISEAKDPRRSTKENNPFSYFLRSAMISKSLLDSGWAPGAFNIVPAFISEPARLLSYLPMPNFTTVFVTVYDDWGDEKAERLRRIGFDVAVLWRRSMNDRLTSGSEVRRLMREGGTWRHLVPSGVAYYLDLFGIDLVKGALP
jgi:cytidyltransferase-like protein